MDAVKLCSDLVKIKSENPPGDTRDCTEYAGAFLESIGIPVAYTEGPDGRNNVYSKKQDGDLLLLGHLDVVPALPEGWEYDPYSGLNDGTYIHGRGSSDMKGGCAALMAALEKEVELHDDLPVSVAFVCDEEGGGSYGTRRLIAEKIIHPEDVLIAEPTPAHAPCIGQKGIYRYSVTFNGQPGHSSLYPRFGTSAIMQATEFLTWLATLNSREYVQDAKFESIIDHSCNIAREIYHEDFSSIYRRIAYNPGVITGGERENIVAQKCSLVIDMRLPWGLTVEDISAEIKAHLPPSAELTERARAVASMTSPDSFLVKSTCSCISEAYQIESKPMVQWAASDARALRLAGFNAIEYGPGELETMHGVNERVRIDQLNTASGIYAHLIEKYYERKTD